jgi:tetratricopeptide (TPR) repeat protein
MFDLVISALEQREFSRAQKLLQAWQQEKPRDPWLALALARYWEATGNFERAEPTYRQLLQAGAHAKLTAQARQGIARVQASQADQRQALLEQARSQPGSEVAALLVLEPVQGEAREAAAQALAQVMQMDIYTARLTLPGQHWRLYRVGNAGELTYFSQQLRDRQMPAFTAPIRPIQTLQVFRVQYFAALQPQPQVICQNAAGQQGSITFAWPEVSQIVRGHLPILESVVDLGPWGKLQRREVTQDYADVMDLHLPGRSCILRLCDRTYRHRQSALPAAASAQAVPTAHAAWASLTQVLSQRATAISTASFSGFGKTALEFLDLLPSLPSHLDLGRKVPSKWDAAFHLYSGLRFYQAAGPGA